MPNEPEAAMEEVVAYLAQAVMKATADILTSKGLYPMPEPKFSELHALLKELTVSHYPAMMAELREAVDLRQPDVMLTAIFNANAQLIAVMACQQAGLLPMPEPRSADGEVLH